MGSGASMRWDTEGKGAKETPLPEGVGSFDEIENRRIGDEIAAVDEGPVAGRLFAEAADEVEVAVREFERTEAPGRSNRGHRGFLAVSAMESDQIGDIDPRD